LVWVFDKDTQFRDTKANDIDMCTQANGTGLDALVQQRHGVGGVHEIRQRSNQLFRQAFLKRSQGTKLLPPNATVPSTDMNGMHISEGSAKSHTSLMILINIQLFDDESNLKKMGANVM
jgi:hypothetical protein